DFVLDAHRKISVGLMVAEILKWKHRDAFLRDICRRRVVGHGSVVPPKEQDEGRSRDPDQTGCKSESTRRFPAIEDLCAAILQLRRECTDIRARCRFGREHRREQWNKGAWNTCRLQLSDRQSLRVLARANLFDGRALERPVAGEQIPESCA